MIRSNYKPALSLIMASAVASVFTISSFAASRPREPTPPPQAAQKHNGILGLPAGRLTGTGHIAIDGNDAQSGVTVLSGSTVATGPDGYAMIDLGSLGRIELQPNTALLVTFSPNRVVTKIAGLGRVSQSLPSGVIGQTTIDSGQARLAVTLGQVEVKSGRDQITLNAGQESPFNSSNEAVASGSAVFAVEQGPARTSSPGDDYISAGKVGVIALLVLAAGATGVVLSNRDKTDTPALPRPSTVVP